MSESTKDALVALIRREAGTLDRDVCRVNHGHGWMASLHAVDLARDAFQARPDLRG